MNMCPTQSLLRLPLTLCFSKFITPCLPYLYLHIVFPFLILRGNLTHVIDPAFVIHYSATCLSNRIYLPKGLNVLISAHSVLVFLPHFPEI